jgi:hypothetical protein
MANMLPILQFRTFDLYYHRNILPLTHVRSAICKIQLFHLTYQTAYQVQAMLVTQLVQTVQQLQLQVTHMKLQQQQQLVLMLLLTFL